MRMQMMQQQQQQQQGMPRPPPPDYKTPIMSSGVASQPGNTMMNQQQSHHVMLTSSNKTTLQQPSGQESGQWPSMVPNPAAQQPVVVGRPSPNGATSPMLQQQQQPGMVNDPQQGQLTADDG